MAGETNLDKLIAGMKPRLDPEVYVFAMVSEPVECGAVMRFFEAEGETLILSEAEAARVGLDGTFRSRRITLEVHSALDAVGFLARITTRLAALGMGVNPVSAFYHDHLFVPADRAEEAMAALEDLSKRA